MMYRILHTDRASDQIYSWIQYMAGNSHNTEEALLHLSGLEKRIMQLAGEPYSGVIPHYSILKKQDYRVLTAEKQLIFYKVNENEKTVTIHAVTDDRAEYRNLV